MHVAAFHGFTDLLSLLLRHGANIESLDDANSTPFVSVFCSTSRLKERLFLSLLCTSDKLTSYAEPCNLMLVRAESWSFLFFFV